MPSTRSGRVRHGRRALAVTPILAAALLAVACSVGTPPMPATPVRPPGTFSATGSETVPARWWTRFDDPGLTDHVERALGGNLDLRAVWYRFREARALVRREASSLVPELHGFADGELARFGSEDDSGFELGLGASYEVDLWNRIEAVVEAEAFRARALRFDYEAAALSLAAEVATTWYRLREAELQLALLDEQIDSNETIRELIAARVVTQQLRGVDLLRQRELIEATAEQKIVERARARLLRHQLAVLLGQAPGLGPDHPASTDALPNPPPEPATGVPVDLVRRRPDLRAARADLLAADRDLAVALRDRYPDLTLTASLSTLEGNAGDLFQTWLSSFAAGLFAPLFDGGQRRAEIDRTAAARERLLADYGQTVLVAFQEVEDALVQEASQRERVASLERQAALADETTEQLRSSYFDGVGNYIDVLAAITDKQRLERALLTNRRLLLEARIALYRALAGPVWACPPGAGGRG